MRSRERTAQKAAANPTSYDLHWAAGFLEGEGCFFAKYSTQKGKRYHTECVSANQVNPEPLPKLLSMFGGHIRLDRYGRNQPIHVWYCHGARALGVMQTLLPLLSTKKREQIFTVMRTVGAIT